MLSFEEIVRKPQNALKKLLIAELFRMGYKPREKEGFLYAEGSSPILLVAHLDTVHKELVKTICYSADGNILMSPEGIGGDDRCGVYMILQIIKKHRCHILFCEDEEIGGNGAHAFVDSDIKPKINYIVELDRHGSNDAVFYDCDNPEFTNFVTGVGFEEEMGSFSDISIIAPALKVAAVNISCGYYNEHTRHEYIDMRVMKKNIALVGKMISMPSKKFEYIEAAYFRKGFWSGCYKEDLFDLGGYYQGINDTEIKTLMILPYSAYIKIPNGEMEECDGQYLIDRKGNVYEYLYDLGVTIQRNGYEACSENGMCVKFAEKEAMEVEVMLSEFIFDGDYRLIG